jgi:hypothetical protein
VTRPGFLASALAIALLVGCGGSSTPTEESDPAQAENTESAATSPDRGRIRYLNDAGLDLACRQETMADVLAGADQVVIATADSIKNKRSGALSPGERDEPRSKFRLVTFRVESSIWDRTGAVILRRGDTFFGLSGGSISAAPKRRRTTYKGIAYIRRGQKLIVPIRRRSPEFPLAIFPVIDSEVQPEFHQRTPLAKQLSGVAVKDLPQVFSQARLAQ